MNRQGGPQQTWDCACGRFVKGHHWKCLCGRHWSQRVVPRGPDQERPRASSRTRQTIRQEHQQKELKREEQEVKQLIGRVATMKRSEATEAMRFLGYEQVPTDVPGIKSYKTRTKQRMFELGRLIIISRKAGKDDPQGFVREISCLKYMMSTCEKLNDQLAELKSKRDRCQEHIRNLSVKLGELQSDYKQSETDLYAWQAAIDELEELEDYMVGEDAPGARGFSTFIPTMQMGADPRTERTTFPPPPPAPQQQCSGGPVPMQQCNMGFPPSMPPPPQQRVGPPVQQPPAQQPLPPSAEVQGIGEMIKVLIKKQQQTDHQMAMLIGHITATSASASAEEYERAKSEEGAHGHQQPPIEVQASPTSIPAAQPDTPTPVADPGIEPTEASLVDPDRDLLSDAHELGPLLSTVEIEDQRPCYSEEVQGLNCYAVVFGLQRFLIDTEQLVAKALEQDRLRFLVRMFKFAPRYLLTLLDVSLLHRRSWVSALAASFDWLVSFMDPDSVPGTGGLDEWLAALQMDPQRFRATIKTVIRRAREWWSDRHLLHLWDIRVHEALAGTPMDVDAVDVVTSYMCYECGQLFKSERALRAHRGKQHPIPTSPAMMAVGTCCSICGWDYRSNGRLYKHLARCAGGLGRRPRPRGTEVALPDQFWGRHRVKKQADSGGGEGKQGSAESCHTKASEWPTAHKAGPQNWFELSGFTQEGLSVHLSEGLCPLLPDLRQLFVEQSLQQQQAAGSGILAKLFHDMGRPPLSAAVTVAALLGAAAMRPPLDLGGPPEEPGAADDGGTALDCPKARQSGASPWRYAVKGREGVALRRLKVGDAYELRCDGAVVADGVGVEVHVNHNHDHPLEGEAVIRVTGLGREALARTSCRTARVAVHGEQGSCIARVPIPVVSWWPLSTSVPRVHLHRQLYSLPYVGPRIHDMFARVDEEEPLIVDVLVVLAAALALSAAAGLLVCACRGAAGRASAEAFVLPPPEGMLVPSAEQVTQKIARGLCELVVALGSSICSGIAMRGNGSASLYLLMLPVVLAPAALWRVALTWHRANDFYLHLCRGERLRFESSLGLSGRLVALLLLVTGARFGYCMAAAWWAGDTSAQAAASGAVVNAFLVRAAWQVFSGIIAIENRLHCCEISCDVLEKADGEEGKVPLCLARREYELLVDSAQVELDLFLQCDPEDTARLQVQWPGKPMIDESRTCTALNRLERGRMFPAMVNATVDNGLWSTEYVFRVQPMQILAKSLVVRGTIGQTEFTRCLPWGELPGTSISLPANVTDVALEVGTDTYEFNLPEDLTAAGAETHDHHDFITGFYGGLPPEKCDEDCRHHPRCVAHASVDAGCYQIIGPHECMKHHGSAPRNRDVKDAEVRRFLEQRTLQGRVCFLDNNSAERCAHMRKAIGDGVQSLNGIGNLMTYINNRSEGLVKLAVSTSSDVPVDTSASSVQFFRGTPSVLAMPAELRFPGNVKLTPVVIMSSRPSIRIELPEYDVPTSGGNLQLHLVPLLEDPGFVALWFDGNASIEASATNASFTEACSQSPGLRRFRACGGRRANGGAEISISLDPWRPPWLLKLRIEPRPPRGQRAFAGFDPLELPVQIGTAGDEEPLQWAVQKRCATDANESLYTPRVIRELAARCRSPRATAKMRQFLETHKNDMAEVASVLMEAGENNDSERLFEELNGSIPPMVLPFLAGAPETVLLAACRTVKDQELPSVLGATPEKALPSLAPCIRDPSRNKMTLLEYAARSQSEVVGRVVGTALSTFDGKVDLKSKLRKAKALAAALGKMPQVATLDLSGNNFGMDLGAAAALAAALGKMPQVTALDLSGNDFGKDPAVVAAVERMKAAHPNLTAKL
ncbi:unnamed protein product [Prorocentrum cordatum]|uniref:C2H2-type domain-containing protein n=1 Tax=Prorocentrum cordatum TaxID=2364126 RepID=A0ABN9V1W6_9DINO|nr:unnamed protein product [Polarella glacialis]